MRYMWTIKNGYGLLQGCSNAATLNELFTNILQEIREHFIPCSIWTSFSERYPIRIPFKATSLLGEVFVGEVVYDKAENRLIIYEDEASAPSKEVAKRWAERPTKPKELLLYRRNAPLRADVQMALSHTALCVAFLATGEVASSYEEAWDIVRKAAEQS